MMELINSMTNIKNFMWNGTLKSDVSDLNDGAK